MQTLLSTSALPDHLWSSRSLPVLDLRDRLQSALGPRFVVERELVGGAMSTVFLVHDLTTRLPVAVKMIADPDSAERARLRHEAAVTARLCHPNVLPLLHLGEDPALIYLVTPFVEGGSLRDRLDDHGPLPAREVVRVMHALAIALSHAHARGITHGDVKPENVLLDGEHVLLADFGAARLRSLTWRADSNRVTGEHPAAATPTAGTPRYMSPEQALGDPRTDPRSDIYSLAAVAMELLTGRPPFSGQTTRAVLLAHLSEPAPSLVARAGVPLRLARILDQSLQKRPADRPASAWTVAAALAPLLESRIVIPFAPALIASSARVAAARRARRFGGIGSDVGLGIAIVAAAILLLSGSAAPMPSGVRVTRVGVDGSETDPALATTCGVSRAVNGAAVSSQSRA